MPRSRRVPASESPSETPADLQTPPTPDLVTPAQPADAAPAARRPSRRRSAASASPAELPAEPPAAESPVPELPSEEPAPRRRGRRAPSDAPLPDVQAPVVETPVAENPTAENPVLDAPAPRRRGRRKIAETPAPPPVEIPLETEAPVADAPPKRRRGRAKAVETETPLVEAVDTAIFDPEASVVETPSTEEASVTETPTAEPSKRRRRRRGGKADDATAESAPVEAAALESPTETPKRRRGRRQTNPPPVEEISVAAPEAVAESPDTTDDASESAGKRGRRRRGRRRRDGDDAPGETLEVVEDGLVTLEPEPVAEEDEEEDDALLPLLPPAPVFVAPPLVPPVQEPPDGAPRPRVSARLETPAVGLTQIVVDETPCAPYFFFVNTETARDGETVERQIRDAAAASIHLFSCVMYLPLLNAYGERSFGPIDALVSQILSADPDGFLLPRLQFVPTNFWARTHSEQMATYADGSDGDVSLASTEFWADCVDALDALISHFADPSTPGGDRVMGFHLDRGEWFYEAGVGPDVSEPNQVAFQNWLHARYQQLYALRAAWFSASVTFEDAAVPALSKAAPPLYATAREGNLVDYALFSSELVAEIIAALASAVKTLSSRQLLVAVSYGYTLEFAARGDSGHLALGKILDSPDINIVAGPNAYSGRGAGGAGAFPSPIDSVRGQGKLYLVEDDTKTFLAEEETEDSYNPKIVGGGETQAVHQRHFGAALAHGAGVTWMDLWGQGWLDNPEIWRELGALTQLAAQSAQISAKKTSPDIAVFIDEASLAYVKSDPNNLSATLVTRTRDLILKTGASVGFYLQSDVTRETIPDAKLYLFANALRVTTAERQAIREKLQKPGKTLAWLYAPGIFDEDGPATQDISETVGLTLRLQPWNSRAGSAPTSARHPITERLRGTRQIGQNEILNPSYAVSDEQATVLAEYASNGATSLAAREHKSGWKSVFFGDPQLTVELLRGLCAYANVPIYNAQDDVVYADPSGVLLVHAAYTGQRTLTLPRRASVYDVFENRLVAMDATTFRAFLRARTTRLFLFGEPETVLSVTGLEPAPAAAAPSDESSAAVDNLQASLANLEVAVAEVLPLLTAEAETQSLTEETDSETADDGEPAEPTDAAPRSRWQRRRAAMRARRDAERQAQSTSTAAEPADAPVDIATLLPGLPPRRPSSAPPPPPAPDADAE